jgi:hypothetical protein
MNKRDGQTLTAVICTAGMLSRVLLAIFFLQFPSLINH